MDKERNSLILRLHEGCNILWIGFKNAFNDSSAYLTDIEISFLRENETQSTLPFGTVGLIYDHPDQIPELLLELINHYPHYRKTAIKFSSGYSQIHNADKLIKRILEVSSKSKFSSS